MCGALDEFPRAAVTEYHKFGGFKQPKRFPHGSESQQSKTKVSAGPRSC